jgi:UDP-GlcNAc:undecaprenyl-phosphate/decaprenyl-phosphate GlcNAc-1-phosphate transferase
MLDFVLLSAAHIIYFGLSFLTVFSLLAVLIRKPSFLESEPKQAPIFYVGAVLIGIIVVLAYIAVSDIWLGLGLVLAGLLVLRIGALDEANNISAGVQLLWQLLIVGIIVTFGWTIHYVSNPWGEGVISLEGISLGLVVLPGSILAIGWLLVVMNAINWLDGVDGLAASIGMATLLVLALVSLMPAIHDERTLSLALIGAGALSAFLIWNFPPARVYLGTSGSWFLGLYIGAVAIVGGGKIVTTLLVLALPILDLVFVIAQRLYMGRKPWTGDRITHLHHRLQAAGYKPRSIALMGLAVTLVLGWAAIVLPTQLKIVAFGTTAVIMAGVVFVLARNSSKVI